MQTKAFVAIWTSLALLWMPVAPTAKSEPLGRVVSQGTAELNGIPMPAETTLFAGDRIATRKSAAVMVTLAEGTKVYLPEQSVARILHVAGQVGVALEQGALGVLAQSRPGVLVQAKGVVVQAASEGRSSYVVLAEESAVVVSARLGTVEVRASNRTVLVEPGKTMRLELAGVPQGPAGVGASAFTPAAKIALIVLVAAGAAAAIAIPLALRGEEVVSPAVP